MPQIATFVDTSLPKFADTTRALIKDGWKKVPNTAENRRTILLKYYEYLVNTNAKLAGISPSSLTPAQLEPVWAKANAEYERYEMYVKNTVVVVADVEMGGIAAGAPAIAVEEVFASPNDVERMQPGYVDIDDILSGLSSMSLGGGKRRRHRSTKRHHKKTHKRHTKRKTHRSTRRR